MMRTKTDSPDDPKCRPWNAKENERNRGKSTLAHEILASSAAEKRAAAFREAKAARWPAQEAADLAEYKRYAAEQEEKKAC